MAEYSLTTPTIVPVGTAVPYNNTIVKGCCNIKHRAGSGLIKIRGGSCCNPAKYRVYFHGNVTNVIGIITLGIYVDGELLPETQMSLVAAAAANVLSVSAETQILADCAESISVRVIAGTDLTVNTANIIVEKEAA